jgi:hypothetical protein
MRAWTLLTKEILIFYFSGNCAEFSVIFTPTLIFAA